MLLLVWFAAFQFNHCRLWLKEMCLTAVPWQAIRRDARICSKTLRLHVGPWSSSSAKIHILRNLSQKNIYVSVANQIRIASLHPIVLSWIANRRALTFHDMRVVFRTSHCLWFSSRLKPIPRVQSVGCISLCAVYAGYWENGATGCDPSCPKKNRGSGGGVSAGRQHLLSRDDRKEVADGQIPVQPLETDLNFGMDLADVCEKSMIAPLFFGWHFPSRALGAFEPLLSLLMMLRQCVVTTLCLSVMPYAKVMKNGKARRSDSARRARNSSWRWRRRRKKKRKVLTEPTEAAQKSWPSQRGLGRLTSEVNWEQKFTLLVIFVSTCGQLAGCGFNALLFKPGWNWNDGFCRHVRRRFRSRTRPSQSLQPSPGTTDVWKELRPFFWNG